MIGLDRQLKGIEANLKRNEPSEGSESRLAAAARAAARTVLVLFVVGTATGPVLRYLVL
jgi:hypothetical protein